MSGSFQGATGGFPSGKALMYFGLFLADGVFFVFIAFTLFLPVMVLVPQKFAICFTLGCALIIASLFALKGPANQLAHMTSKEVPLQLSLACCTLPSLAFGLGRLVLAALFGSEELEITLSTPVAAAVIFG